MSQAIDKIQIFGDTAKAVETGKVFFAEAPHTVEGRTVRNLVPYTFKDWKEAQMEIFEDMGDLDGAIHYTESLLETLKEQRLRRDA